ncbi:D-alanyl-D-alanine carboxypeptidase [Oxalobacter sp. OttesenSCG-928-P03]|nr:D-alanyl-D-alanine carboxypeptidase [Oxalobacter sp. OttesenSCG-928-P03]
MRKLKYGLISFLMLFAFGSLSVQAAPKKPAAKKKATVVAKKKKAKTPAGNRVHATRKPSGEIVVDSRVTATRKLLAQDQGHTLVNYQRGSAKLAPIMFPEFTPPSARTTFSVAQLAGLDKTADPLSLSSSAAYVLDQSTLGVLFQKNANIALPMASITKLMTGLVVVESMQDMSEIIEITRDDAARAISSRLKVGTKTTRGNLLHLALMSSENRAAAALGRNYPGGYSAFVAAMNVKARVLGMSHTYYVDTTGLSSDNVASAQDLAKLVMAAAQYPILRQFSTDTGYVINDGFQPVHYSNTNRLVHNPNLNIELQKTGFISAAGNCLVMQAIIEERPIVMVFLDAKGKDSRIADVMKIRNWIQRTNGVMASKPHV